MMFLTYFLYFVLVASVLGMIYSAFQVVISLIRLHRYEKELRALQQELLNEINKGVN